jgi:hypothetical protein
MPLLTDVLLLLLLLRHLLQAKNCLLQSTKGTCDALSYCTWDAGTCHGSILEPPAKVAQYDRDVLSLYVSWPHLVVYLAYITPPLIKLVQVPGGVICQYHTATHVGASVLGDEGERWQQRLTHSILKL